MATSRTHHKRVFISYSRADSATIDRLEAELISYGFKTWVDRQHLEGGDKWAEKIEQAIQECDAVVVGLSPDAVASPWVTNELFYAQQLEKTIIPVLLHPVKRIPLLIVAIQYISMHVDESQGLQQLRLRLLRLGEHATTTGSAHPAFSQTSSHRIASTAQEHSGEPAAQLVALPAAAPTADLNDLFQQGFAAKAHGDLEQAEALLSQVVERDARFGDGVAAQQLEETRQQLLPPQLARLRQQGRQAEAKGAWAEAIGAWKALLERVPDDVETQTALERDQQNRDASWLYSTARDLVQKGDWSAFQEMWRLLHERAPFYGDPDEVFALVPPEYVRGAVLLTLAGHTNAVAGIAWSPDGTRLATASKDQTVRIWEAATGKQLIVCKGHTGYVTSVAWSPDGQRLASSCDDNADRTVRVWEAATGNPLVVCSGHTGGVSSVAWSPDGQRLATASVDQTARTWEAATGKPLHILQGHTETVFGIAWSPDGQRLATASGDKTARTWEAATGKQSNILQGHTATVNDISWAPNGQHLATAGWDYSVRTWDANSGKQILALQNADKMAFGVAWSPDSYRLVSCDHHVHVWNASTGKLLFDCQGQSEVTFSVAWSAGRRAYRHW